VIASASDGVATARCNDVADWTRASKNRRAPSKGWAPFVESPAQGGAGLERALCLPERQLAKELRGQRHRRMTLRRTVARQRPLMGGREARSGARWPPTSSPRSAVPANRRHLPARPRGKSTVRSQTSGGQTDVRYERLRKAVRGGFGLKA
jgi:hypothetical protein